MIFADTHAHIYADKFQKDREEVLRRSFEADVTKIYMPNIDHSSIDAMLAVEEKHPENCFPMMGLHPCYVKKGFEKELYIVEDWLNKRDFVAVGEIGTDLYWDKSTFDIQAEAFKIQVNWAKEKKKPIIIHCRESFDETVEILESLNDENLRGIFHCFTGSLEDAEKAIALGFHLGIGGVSTFKKGGLDKVLPHISLDHLVLETDCPYLAPVPHRGKRNETTYVPIIAQRVAELCEKTIEEVAEITTSNAVDIFGI